MSYLIDRLEKEEKIDINEVLEQTRELRKSQKLMKNKFFLEFDSEKNKPDPDLNKKIEKIFNERPSPPPPKKETDLYKELDEKIGLLQIDRSIFNNNNIELPKIEEETKSDIDEEEFDLNNMRRIINRSLDDIKINIISYLNNLGITINKKLDNLEDKLLSYKE